MLCGGRGNRGLTKEQIEKKRKAREEKRKNEETNEEVFKSDDKDVEQKEDNVSDDVQKEDNDVQKEDNVSDDVPKKKKQNNIQKKTLPNEQHQEEEEVVNVWPLNEVHGTLEDSTSMDSADYMLHNVRGDGNCFYYALLRASKAKNVEPGKSKWDDTVGFSATEEQLLKNREIKPPRKAMRALKKDFKKLFENEKVKKCATFQENVSNAAVDKKEFQKNLVQNKCYIQYIPGIHDVLFHCLYGIKLRVYNGGVGAWDGRYQDEDPRAVDVVNLYFFPETEEEDGHYMWLEPVTTLQGGEDDDIQLKDLVFDSTWFGAVADTTLANHRKRLEILQHAMPDAYLVKDIDQIVAYIEKRYKAPFNVYSTLRKVLRKVAPTSAANQLIRKKPTRSSRNNKQLMRQRSPNEKKLWVEWPTIDRVTAKLYKKVKQKQGTDEDYHDLLLLGLYVYNDPRRNDYHNMKMGAGSGGGTHQNYCDLKNRVFIFHEYKTAKFYKTQRIPISDRLVKIIRWYHDRFGYDYLVAPTPLTTSQFTDRMKATTKRRLGKELGSRMLRKIFITFKSRDQVKEMMDRAKKMGHNFHQSLSYIRVN